MAKNQTDKTNVMRILEQKGIAYTPHSCEGSGAVSGAEVAAALGENPEHMFKTLVTVGNSKEHYVFVIPVPCTLNFKKAAKAVGEKSIEMIAQKELLPLTGYVHGGCSPVGMKKLFTTVFDETALLYDSILFSAGKIACQVELDPNDIGKLIPAVFADVAD